MSNTDVGCYSDGSVPLAEQANIMLYEKNVNDSKMTSSQYFNRERWSDSHFHALAISTSIQLSNIPTKPKAIVVPRLSSISCEVRV